MLRTAATNSNPRAIFEWSDEVLFLSRSLHSDCRTKVFSRLRLTLGRRAM